jgi:hypothetical protein
LRRYPTPAIKMVEEDEATADIKEIYGDIKSTLGIDFVPNMYKLMAPNPPQGVRRPSPFQGGALRYQIRQQKMVICRYFKPSSGLEPETPSLPWKFRSVTRVHARSFATQFFLQIHLSQAVAMRRETTRVSFLMCPFCVRCWVSIQTTRWRRLGPAPSRSANVMCQPPLAFSAFHWSPVRKTNNRNRPGV